MSTEIATILVEGRPILQMLQDSGGSKEGISIQITQGFASGPDEPGFIHLTQVEARILARELKKWLTSLEERK